MLDAMLRMAPNIGRANMVTGATPNAELMTSSAWEMRPANTLVSTATYDAAT